MKVTPLNSRRLARAKTAYTTRHVRPEALQTLLSGGIQPEAGDLVLARVEEIGQHPRLERPDGRRASIFPGDEIVVCYGNRYAPDFYEAEIPAGLGPCDLVAAGGIAASVRSRHTQIRPPTTLQPAGLLGDRDGRRMNLRDWGIGQAQASTRARPPTIAVVGTAMNSGKTTAAAAVTRGLTRAGLAVGAAKVTGTGAGGDLWLLADSGAQIVLDFTSAGYPSTYLLSLEQVIGILHLLTDHLTAAGVEVIVLEVADGVYQRETAALLASADFAGVVDRMVFAAGDALGAVAGVDWLRRLGLPVGAVSGRLTASPLALREAQAALDIPVLTRDEAAQPATAACLLAAMPAVQ